MRAGSWGGRQIGHWFPAGVLTHWVPLSLTTHFGFWKLPRAAGTLGGLRLAAASLRSLPPSSQPLLLCESLLPFSSLLRTLVIGCRAHRALI